jgi:type II restriction enzyme
MTKLTVAELVDAIAQLDLNRSYEYVSGRSRLKITNIRQPEGPIGFISWDSRDTESDGRSGSISSNQLATIALVCSNRPNYPLHVDRLFSAGGNSRSALETVLAHTPHFFMCYPERIDSYTGETLQNLKHIMWCPQEAHPLGQIVQKEYVEIITEVELGVDFGSIGVTADMLGSEFDTIEAKKTHTQMQIALIEIGRALNFRTWIARNDRSIPVKDARLGDLEGVIESLDEVPIFYKREIKEAAALIDCIWFTQDGDRIPAIIEVEHTTGVTSGMTRMLKLKEIFPSVVTTFTIVAPNKLRDKVVSEANQKAFRPLKAKYMPYSTVRELYGLIRRYSLSNVVDHTFINPFMENVVEG